MARALEGEQLVTEGHHTPQRLEIHPIGGVSILGLVVVVVAHTPEPYLALRQRHSLVDGIVGELLETPQRDALARLHDAYP